LEHDQNINGKSTGKKLTNKELVSILENDTAKQKEKIEEKDNEVLSLNQQIQELEKDIFSEERTEIDQDGNEQKSKNIDVVKQLEKENEKLQSENNTLTTRVEYKKIQITSDAKILTDSQDKIEILEKLLEPTGYEIEGESVSEKLYDYVEKKRHTLNYKSTRVDSLEEKLDYQKERVEARNKLMNEERIRHERVEEKFIEKEESLNEQIQELKKDVFSETWTRKDKNGEKQKSKNINVVKQLEKKREELKETIKTLTFLAYTGIEYPIELDENDKPVKFEKETWKGKIEYTEDQVRNLSLEIKEQSEKILELKDLAYYDEQIYNPEIDDWDSWLMTYKDENVTLKKELDTTKKMINTMRDYNVPISKLEGNWDEIKDNILNTGWEKRKTLVEKESTVKQKVTSRSP